MHTSQGCIQDLGLGGQIELPKILGGATQYRSVLVYRDCVCGGGGGGFIGSNTMGGGSIIQ